MRRRGRKRIQIRSRHTPLRMTSMMDILTVLLLFLLKSFVVEGEVITPVPGGVGPMTIAMLLQNTLKVAVSGEELLTPVRQPVN